MTKSKKAASSKRVPSTFLDLSRKGASVQLDIAAEQLPRLSDAVAGVDRVNIALRFGLNPQGRAQATGSILAEMQIDCHLCLAPRPTSQTFEVAALLARDEAQAGNWWAQDKAAGIVVVGGELLDLAQFAEDEILIALNERVCQDEQCIYRPAMAFSPAVDERPGDANVKPDSRDSKVVESDSRAGTNEIKEYAEQGTHEGPFAALAVLKEAQAGRESPKTGN